MIPAPFTGYRGEIRPEWLSEGSPHLNAALASTKHCPARPSSAQYCD